MKGLENNDLFKYNANKSKTTGSVELFNQQLQIFEYIPASKENRSQGTFNFLILNQSKVLKLLITKAGAVPLLENQISKYMNWKLQNDLFGYFKDTGKQWIVQFPDVETANFVTALIGMYLSCQSIKTVATYDAFQKPGPELSEGDVIKMAYSAFPVEAFPKIGPSSSSSDGHKITISGKEMPVGLVAGIIGMSTGSIRVIFVPENQCVNSSGTKESWMKDKPYVYIVSILNSKFHDESKKPQQPTESPAKQESPVKQRKFEPEPEPEPQKVEEKEKSDSPTESAAKEQNDESKSDNVSDANESNNSESNADQPEPSGDSFAAKIAKFKRIGAHASPFATAGVPLIMVKKKIQEEEERQRREEEERQKREESQADDTTDSTVEEKPKVSPKSSNSTHEKPQIEVIQPKVYQSPERKKVVIEDTDDGTPANNEIVKEIEQSISSHISKLTTSKTDSVDSIVKGVATMAAQLKVADSELATLKAQVEAARQKSSTGSNIQKQYDDAQADIRYYKKKLSENENLIKGVEEKLKNSSAGSGAKGETAKATMKSIIKDLTQSTFTGMNEEFDENETYTGQEIIDALLVLLKKQAYVAIGRIDEEGLC